MVDTLVTETKATPLKSQILGSDHEAYLVLHGVQYSRAYPDLLVDVDVLTQGLTQGEVFHLRASQNDHHSSYCCYVEEGDGEGLEPFISGFARITIYSKAYGIEQFMEGHFTGGKQDDFGRVIRTQSYQPKQYYTVAQKFTGWWADGTDSGMGAAKTDGGEVSYGEWVRDASFPLNGQSWITNAPGYTKKVFDSFNSRKAIVNNF